MVIKYVGRMTYRVVWSLKEPEDDIVEVEFPLVIFQHEEFSLSWRETKHTVL